VAALLYRKPALETRRRNGVREEPGVALGFISDVQASLLLSDGCSVPSAGEVPAFRARKGLSCSAVGTARGEEVCTQPRSQNRAISLSSPHVTWKQISTKALIFFSKSFNENKLSLSLRHPLKNFLVGLEFEFRASTLAKQVLYCLNHTSSPFCSGYFGDGWGGSLKLFAQVGLEP
jgi:hypothetical protein